VKTDSGKIEEQVGDRRAGQPIKHAPGTVPINLSRPIRRVPVDLTAVDRLTVAGITRQLAKATAKQQHTG